MVTSREEMRRKMRKRAKDPTLPIIDKMGQKEENTNASWRKVQASVYNRRIEMNIFGYSFVSTFSRMSHSGLWIVCVISFQKVGSYGR